MARIGSPRYSIDVVYCPGAFSTRRLPSALFGAVQRRVELLQDWWQRRMRVEIKDSESFDQLLKRFTKGIERSGIIREHRRGLRFISAQEENRAKRRKAERRRRRNAAA